MRGIGQWFTRALRSPRLPWVILGFVLLIALVHEILRPVLFENLTPIGQAALWSLTALILVLAFLIISRLASMFEQRAQLEQRLAQAERQLAESDQRLEAVFGFSQKFAEASDENEVVDPILSLLVELTCADGASFVPLDEHGQPQAAFSHGELPFPVTDAWLEYLASEGVRQRCRNCANAEALIKPADCPLLKGPLGEPAGMLCLSVQSGEREFGVVTLFVSDLGRLDQRAQAYLRALVDEMALGLEGVRLRRNELAALRQMQLLRQKTDLKALLNSLLENVHRTLEADYSAMLVSQPGEGKSALNLTLGELPAPAWPFVSGVLQSVMASGDAVLLGDVAGNPSASPALRSLISVPLLSPEGAVLGSLLVGDSQPRAYHQRQLALLQTIGGQVALVVQNASLMAELEYNILLQERHRLAREIHDGVAQTLGFLKLQLAQMRNFMGRGEGERLRQSLDLCYQTLSEAYQDARQSIDGLRISPAECGLGGWLAQTANDFSELSGLVVDLEEVEAQTELPPEVHAQLIRIVQEALSNVRKHAHATQVQIACREVGDDLLLEVRDDGNGFSPEDVSMPSRHGLRGMRERAELIGADFQVISRSQDGTIVRLRLPLKGLGEVIL